MVDIIGSAYKNDKLEIENWYSRKDLLKRQFSVMAICYTEVMSLSNKDLYRIQMEFLEYWENLIEDKDTFLHKLLIIKLAAIKMSNKFELDE